MDRARLLAIGVVLLAAALLLSLAPDFLNSTGLFGLQAKDEGLKLPETPSETTEENEGIKAGLSFTVLEPTLLEASILSSGKLRECPEETEVEILLKNTGSSPAEKVFLEFGPGIKATACSNCRLEELQPEQETVVKTRLCLESASLQTLTIGSANSNTVELQFEK